MKIRFDGDLVAETSEADIKYTKNLGKLVAVGDSPALDSTEAQFTIVGKFRNLDCTFKLSDGLTTSVIIQDHDGQTDNYVREDPSLGWSDAVDHKIVEAFKLLDRDGSGSVSLQAWTKSMGEGARDFFDDADANQVPLF